MRRLVLTTLLAAVTMPVVADTYVEGYTRDDGTRVEGHYRTEPNEFKFDNYSAEGNTNPYTGEPGYKDHEFSSPDLESDYGTNSGYDTDFDTGYDW
ncbi:hypothetical protein J2T55_000202 [Methylohalomonas lacus]|uniref:Uncharacterized protein n=1 Tax=Methylohalomonas lacus TaxID=398773 RepID=A0AAE3HHZ7_9GAMM|nr:hypothetical protein [Methylohalomonas lacus]MCS3902210.1 hypothetical protein [Methylohalomonas lacus]